VPATLLILTIPMVAIIDHDGAYPRCTRRGLDPQRGPCKPVRRVSRPRWALLECAASIVRAGFSAPKSGKKFVS